MKILRRRLSAEGVKRSFLNEVILPSWWNDSLAEAPGGMREAAAYVCARLGFNLASLMDERHPLALCPQPGVKFKKAAGVTEAEVCQATHYALGVARTVASSLLETPASLVPSPRELRERLLVDAKQPWIGLRDILNASWGLGIPVIHVTKVPAGVKKPDALATMIGDRPVIVVLSARKSPAWIAFMVAHELGHIHHGHVRSGQTLVDEKFDTHDGDRDESQANEFASQLLTGQTDLGLHSHHRLNAFELAASTRVFAARYRVAPGVAALNYAFTTGFWPVANGALRYLEGKENASAEMKDVADAHLSKADLSDDARDYIARATGALG
jgi:hypothetical protein